MENRWENEIKLEVPPIRFHSWTEVPIQEREGEKNGKEEIIRDLIQKNFLRPKKEQIGGLILFDIKNYYKVTEPKQCGAGIKTDI